MMTGERWRSLRASVRVRMTAAAVVVIGVTLLVAAVALVASLHAVLVREAHATASLRASEAARVIDSGGDPAAGLAGDDDTVLQVIERSGAVMAATPNAAGHGALADIAAGQSREIDVPFDDDPYLMVAASADGGRIILVGRSLDGVSESTRALVALLAVGLPLLLVAVGATTWRVVGRALAPVDAIRAEVDAISATDPGRRVAPPASRDEVGRLATTMNRMLDRLERARTRERRFAADASHELRSPIAAIRQHAEVALGHPELGAGLAETVHAESLRMQALVDDLLLLARADEHSLPLRRRPTDLDDIVFAEARRLREWGTVAVDTSGVSAVRVDADQAALRRVLRNLGDNAARHAAGRVRLALRAADGWARLDVEDDGPGVPPAERARVFDRFVRLDEARGRVGGGSGLGLAIVAELVAAHGGSVSIEDAPLGGARVSIRIPLPDV
jgi:signal transduction histidine kinase